VLGAPPTGSTGQVQFDLHVCLLALSATQMRPKFGRTSDSARVAGRRMRRDAEPGSAQ
jgi:hypothetical protein